MTLFKKIGFFVQKMYLCLRKFFCHFLNHHHEARRAMKNYRFRIISEDNNGSRFVIAPTHKVLSFFEVSLETLSGHLHVVEKLNPEEACYLGVKYGERFKSTRKIEKTGKPILTGKQLTSLRFSIRGIARDGTVDIYSFQTHTLIKRNPIDLVKSELIKEMDALQSFFIGMQAGIQSSHNREREEKKQQRFHKLRIVT